MSTWKTYQRKGSIEARPWVNGEDLTGISVSEQDLGADSGWIARNPDNHADKWFINATYFAKNYHSGDEKDVSV